MEKNELRKITQEELKDVLENHEQWLITPGTKGKRADLSYADLSYTDLSGVNLEGAILVCTDLSGANLAKANLSFTSLTCADLIGANLEDANLANADLRAAKLAGSDLSAADLSCANLLGVDLRYTKLRDGKLVDVNLIYAKLTCADLTNAKLAGADLLGVDLKDAHLANANLTDVKNFPNIPMACPKSGSFIGWKCACGYIVKLEIPEDAKRSSGTGEKCRCSKAKVLSIEHTDSTPLEVTDICSNFDSAFIYKVGETVIADDFDNNRFNECTHGIHFYMDRDLAVYWSRIL